MRSVIAVISAGSKASIALHKKLGFEHAGTLQSAGFKFDQWVDVIFMQRPTNN